MRPGRKAAFSHERFPFDFSWCLRFLLVLEMSTLNYNSWLVAFWAIHMIYIKTPNSGATNSQEGMFLFLIFLILPKANT